MHTMVMPLSYETEVNQTNYKSINRKAHPKHLSVIKVYSRESNMNDVITSLKTTRSIAIFKLH